MRALVQSAGPLSLAARRLLGGRAARWPAAGVLRLQEVADPGPPAPGWVRLRPLLSGVCGSDLASLRGTSPTVLWPLVSFPSVPGHEVVARVEAVGEGVEGVRPGDRVVVDPCVSCFVRGLPPCEACRAGETALCRRAAQAGGGLGRGMMVGYHRDLPGGWAEAMRVHASQVYRVPEGVEDRTALWAEPLAVALHALLPLPWGRAERVLVIGGGSIGLACVAALGLLGAPAPVVAVRHRHQAAAVRRLGGRPLEPGEGPWPRAGGGVSVRGWAGRPLWLGGFDAVVDAVGGDAVFARAVEATRAGGWTVRVGDVGTLPRPGRMGGRVWAPDARILQPFAYGREGGPGGPHTLELALRGLADSLDREALAALVTHVFPLEAYREALQAAFDHRRHASVKVAFAPAGDQA
jgi:threonine dehydrogenase-like Zn-dependent dehydrogenase